MTRSQGIALAFALLVACLIVLGFTDEFLVDWTWFSSVGFAGVFWTIIGAKGALFTAVFVATAIVVWVNGALALRFAPSRAYLRPRKIPWESLGSQDLPAVIERFLRRLPWHPLVKAISVVTGMLVALGWAADWNLALSYIFQVPYGRSDPLYGNDFSFYLFSLPAFVALKDWDVMTGGITTVKVATALVAPAIALVTTTV